MTCTTTPADLESRALLLESIASLRTIGEQVYKQRNLDPHKRIVLLDLLLDAERLVRRWEGK